jgi:hypothetical protein
LGTGGEIAAQEALAIHARQQADERAAQGAAVHALNPLLDGGLAQYGNQLLEEYMQTRQPDAQGAKEKEKAERENSFGAKQSLVTVAYASQNVLQVRKSGGSLMCNLVPMGQHPKAPAHSTANKINFKEPEEGKLSDDSNARRHLKNYHVPRSFINAVVAVVCPNKDDN